MFETLIQDVRHGSRMLVKNPGFSLVAIASIAVGVAVVRRDVQRGRRHGAAPAAGAARAARS